MVIWKDYSQDLDKDIIVRDDDYKLINKNQNSNGIRVTLTHGTTAADLTGLYCHGYVLCRNGVTYHAYGSGISGITGNQAWFIVPTDVYLVPGLAIVTIMLSSNSGATGTSSEFAVVLSVRMVVEKVVSNDQREPSSVALQLENITDMYQAMTLANSNSIVASQFVPNVIVSVHDNTKPYSQGERVVSDNLLYYAMNDVPANTQFDGTTTKHYFVPTNVSNEIDNAGIGIRYFFVHQTSREYNANVFHGTFAHKGVRWVLNGYTDASSGTKFFLDLSNNVSYPYTNNATPYNGDETIKLVDGHVYQVLTRHISGTKTNSSTIPYARAIKYASDTAIPSSYADTVFTVATTGDICSVFTYDSSTTPNGIILVLYCSRTGGQTFSNYTIEVTLRDITKTGLELGYVAPVEISPAISSHAVGDLLMYNGCLVKVTTAISAGQTLSTSTNISVTTIAEELSAIRQLLN